MGKIEDTKDMTVGKVMETAGKVVDDKKLEFSGKFQTMTAGVKNRLSDKKEEVVQEANKLIDGAESRLNKKK
jgi:uncharacterized protein YjbJ (UPF0337 family)